MPNVLVFLVFVTGTYWMCANAGSCPFSPLYPYGRERGDQTVTFGDDDYYNIPLNVIIDFYGNKYDSAWMDINGIISFTKPIIESKVQTTPHRTPFFSPYWSDVNLLRDDEGIIFYRTVNLTREPDVVVMVEKDAALSGHPMKVQLIMMVTWFEVRQFGQPSDVNNTFQGTLISDGNTTLTIFNYGSINWWEDEVNAGIIFNRGDKKTRIEYSISTTDEVGNVGDYSNIGFPGKIVTKVNGDIQLRNLTRFNCVSCIIDRANGNVTTFDGSTELVANDMGKKYLISKEYQGDQAGKRDPCKFMLKTTTDGNGRTDWVAFTIGVKLKWNYAFERVRDNIVEVRSRKTKQIISAFPYHQLIEDYGQRLFVVIEKIRGGWILRSPSCEYLLVYKPLDYSKQLRLFLGPHFEGRTIGMCQNNNHDVTDDRKKCSTHPEDVSGPDFATVIGDSCSCAKANKRCKKALSRM